MSLRQCLILRTSFMPNLPEKPKKILQKAHTSRVLKPELMWKDQILLSHKCFPGLSLRFLYFLLSPPPFADPRGTLSVSKQLRIA